MPQVSDTFSNYPVTVVLDASGNGTIAFQATGANVRVTNLFAAVSSSVKQAVVTIYKGQIAPGNALDNSNSGSTGAKASGAIDLYDGETIFVQWVGGDVGATATATFTGKKIPFNSQVIGADFAFDDNFAAGDGTMIYPALKSVNYVAGVSGWYLDRNGNLEANNVTARGELLASSTSGAYVLIFADDVSGRIVLQPPDSATPGMSFFPAQIYTQSTGDNPVLILDGPGRNVGGPFGELTIGSSGTHSTMTVDAELIVLGDGNPLHPNSSVTIPSQKVLVGPDQGDIGRGLLTGVSDTGDSAAIGNTLTSVLTTSSWTFRANRAYEVRLAGRLSPSAVNMSPGMALVSSAGTTLYTYGRLSTPLVAQYAIPNPQAVFTVGSSDLLRTVSLQLISNTAGQTVTQNGRRSLKIYDIGQAVDYPDAAIMV